MNRQIVTAGRAPRKVKNKPSDVYYPPGPDDLIALDTLGEHGQQKVRRLRERGEIETCRRNGQDFSRRAELADFDVIYFDAAITLAGEFLGDSVRCF